MTATPRDFVSRAVAAIPPSGIRRFFDVAATMQGVISLGVGEPDFVTPAHVIDAAKASLDRGKTGYTSNRGLIELRERIAHETATRYGATYDPVSEVIVTTEARGKKPEVEEAALAWIERAAAGCGASRLVVHYIGGEPLTRKDYVLRTARHLGLDLEASAQPINLVLPEQ